MSRFRRLAACLLIAASQARALDRAKIVAKANVQVARGCGSIPASCAELRAINQGYQDLLKTAASIDPDPPTVAAARDLFYSDWALDEREHALPSAARASAGERPLLQLSLLVISHATLALAAADPKAAPPFRFVPKIGADKIVELVCFSEPKNCAAFRSLQSQLAELTIEINACVAGDCPFDRESALATRVEAANRDYYLATNATKVETLQIFTILNDLRASLTSKIAHDTARRLDGLESGARSLQERLAALEKRSTDINPNQIQEFQKVNHELLAQHRKASIGADRAMALFLDDAEATRLRDRVNAATAVLAGVRARLLARQAAGSLAADKRPDLVASIAAGYKNSPRPPPRTMPLIDQRVIPKPPPSNPTAPPICAAAPTNALELRRRLGSVDPLERADALRRLGLTQTLGDPGGRAGLVHPQAFPDACAIVTQQEVLLGQGLLSRTGDPVAQEGELRRQAIARGFLNSGTSPQYASNLLVERGLLVDKRYHAPLGQLDDAVRRGGWIIAAVDARWLWNIPAKSPLGHSILITGIEVVKLSGTTLGYYINDSGEKKGHNAYFVPIERFQKAWNDGSRTFSEVR